MLIIQSHYLEHILTNFGISLTEAFGELFDFVLGC